MGKIYFITGGAYSGKSAFAENIAANFERLGIMTLGKKTEDKKENGDEDNTPKDAGWVRVVVDGQCDSVLAEQDFDLFVLDSLTALVRRRFSEGLTADNSFSKEKLREISESVSREVMNMVVAAKDNGRNLLVISSEVGMGIGPEGDATRFFRAETGRANQLMASLADEAYLLVSGIPIKIKG